MVPLPPSKAFLKISREKGLIDITGAGDTIERELGTSEKPVRKGGGGKGGDGNERRRGRDTKGVSFLLNMVYKRGLDLGAEGLPV